MRDHLIEVLREFAGAILNPYDPDELLHRLTKHAVQVLDGSGAGIMLQSEAGGLSFAAASDEDVVRIELHQERVAEGACYEAFERNELVVVEDIEQARERWPGYSERVVEADLRSVIGVPMNAFGRTIGVLNIYRAEAGPWTENDIEAAEIVSTMGAGYIVHAHEIRAQHDLAEHLQTAIDSRDLIGQAKGLVMAREQVGADEAFVILRRTSQETNTKLREVARLVIDDHIQLSPPTDPGVLSASPGSAQPAVPDDRGT